ncbi:hypothetical protein [Azospirillum sp. B2RO_4]|uniref:hypothetical protein n=1 Tax=Azospirillum sp. B2RO_4 TaxID=3027796 RepID=UPI003DA9579A
MSKPLGTANLLRQSKLLSEWIDDEGEDAVAEGLALVGVDPAQSDAFLKIREDLHNGAIDVSKARGNDDRFITVMDMTHFIIDGVHYVEDHLEGTITEVKDDEEEI